MSFRLEIEHKVIVKHDDKFNPFPSTGNVLSTIMVVNSLDDCNPVIRYLDCRTNILNVNYFSYTPGEFTIGFDNRYSNVSEQHTFKATCDGFREYMKTAITYHFNERAKKMLGHLDFVCGQETN